MDQYCSQWFYHNSIFDYLFIFIVISIRKWNFLRSMYILEFLFLVRCFQASDPTWGHVNHHRLQNSLNIDFTGIHALEHLFSIKIYEQLDQYEIFRTILKFWVLIGPTLVTPLGWARSRRTITDDATLVHLGAVHILPNPRCGGYGGQQSIPIYRV